MAPSHAPRPYGAQSLGVRTLSRSGVEMLQPAPSLPNGRQGWKHEHGVTRVELWGAQRGSHFFGTFFSIWIWGRWRFHAFPFSQGGRSLVCFFIFMWDMLCRGLNMHPNRHGVRYQIWDLINWSVSVSLNFKLIHNGWRKTFCTTWGWLKKRCNYLRYLSYKLVTTMFFPLTSRSNVQRSPKIDEIRLWARLHAWRCFGMMSALLGRHFVENWPVVYWTWMNLEMQVEL